jgi:hypothetical protein
MGDSIIMSLDLTQFRDLVVRVTTAQELCSEVSTNLILGTCAKESAFGIYLKQMGEGPALGIFQIEPKTEQDIWNNYLFYGRANKRKAIYQISGVRSYNNNGALEWNIAYGICMCRLHYRRIAEPFPALDDIEALGWYWDTHYNRNPLKGTVAQFVKAYEKYVNR